MAVARKLGVTDAEVDRLCLAVVDALDKGPLLPDELKDATGGAVRSLGPDGAKKGIGSTLPLALGRLQVAGEIRRVPTNGRLDQQRYRYARWATSPLALGRLPRDRVHLELAHRFFRWIGPATPTEFQRFSGLGAKVAKAVLAELKLVPLRAADDRLMFPDDLEAFGALVPPPAARYALVSSLDGVSHLRRDVEGLVEPGDAKLIAPGAKNNCQLGALPDLSSHAILDRGRLVGLWEYDPDAGEIAWWSTVPADQALRAAVSRTEALVRAELGDARAFSLDSPGSRAPRIAALRKAAAIRGSA